MNTQSSLDILRSRYWLHIDLKGFKGQSQLGNYVWRFDPVLGIPRVVADQLVKPNGLALSQDETRLYLTDTGFQQSDKTDINPDLPRTIYVYDFDGPKKNFLVNRRVFAVADTGIPDGVKVDKVGNVWAACGDGLNVWDSYGDLIGKILIDGGLNNFAFAGPYLDNVIMLVETKIYQTTIAL